MGLDTPRMGRLHSFSAEAASCPRLHGDEWAGILSPPPSHGYGNCP
jgi:hypothetical protein